MKLSKIFSLLMLLAVMIMQSNAVLAETVVIVHPSNALANLSKSEIKRLFLVKRDTFPDGSKATPVDQTNNTDFRNAFYKSITNKNESQMKAYWSKMIFSGKASPPEVLDNDAAVKAWVASNPSGIGYIESSQVDETVKVVFTVH
tara:strand:- start:1983 stop:2417 length:435 start_codon:yes stop_codon:yes gene_type:complete